MPDGALIEFLSQRADALRRHLIVMASGGHKIHIGGSMSIADIMAALFFHFLDVEGASGPKDRFILSKGHTVHAYHACLAEMGLVDPEEFTRLGQSGGRLAGHPSLKAPLVEFATGSLGHGLSVGLGMAMAEAMNKTRAKTVVLMGDGEMQEGSIWEAVLAAPRFGVENLLAIVDCNQFQSSGAVADIVSLDPFEDKWKSFNWNTKVVDGFNMESILSALEDFPAAKGPTVIISNTLKGGGIPCAVGTKRAHQTTLSEEEAREALGLMEA